MSKLKYMPLFFITVIFIVIFGCSKKYGYNFENGTGSDGYTDSSGMVIDTAMTRIDASKFIAAQIYPGMVSPEQKRVVDTVLNIDLSYETATSSDLRVSVLPSNWISTGLWAPAGELVKIVIPEGIYGLTVQVGSHTDNLTGKEVLQRDPIIYIRKSLYPGVNYVRNLYGGLIYILPQKPLGLIVPVTFTGACAGANYVLGKTTDEEWRQMVNNTTVPFFELIGKRIAFTLPKANLALVAIPSPTNLMSKWDSLIKAVYYDWYGLTDNNPDVRNRTPYLPWRIVFDIQPSAGAMHSGSPIVAGQTSNYFRQAVSIDALENSNWGVFHEIGHNMQMHSTWTFSNNGEVTCNLFSLKKSSIYNYDPGPLYEGWYGTLGQTPSASSFLALDSANKDWFSLTNLGATYPRLSFYSQIFKKYGYEFMAYLATAARNARFTAIDNQSKVDFFYERLCEYTKTDMYRFMREWGLMISQTSRNTIAAKGFPKLKTNVWMYNPVTNTGGGESILPRIEFGSGAPGTNLGWTVLSITNTRLPLSTYGPQNLLDGNLSSIWCSCFNGCYEGPNTAGATPNSTGKTMSSSYPFSAVVQTGSAAITADGFYIVQRKSGNSNHLPSVTIEISMDNSSWTDLGTFELKTAQNSTVAEAEAKQYINLEAPVTFKYFRWSWPRNTTDVNNNTAFTEMGAYHY
ncbi:MAG: M60 family metallopeptidase [Niabella sp.]